MAAVATNVPEISFASEKAISEPSDVIANLQYLFDHAESFDAGEGEIGYVFQPVQDRRVFPPPPWHYKVSVRLIEFDIYINRASLATTLAAYLNAPLIGHVLIGRVIGNLKEGVSLSFGYGEILKGNARLKLEDRTITLFWEYSTHDKLFSGSKTLGHI